jgi:hypothetical protein
MLVSQVKSLTKRLEEVEISNQQMIAEVIKRNETQDNMRKMITSLEAEVEKMKLQKFNQQI